MATPDMDVIREIPGYKVILKAILKSQIQQLVEHLSSHTDEESVFLTASVSDGTLSHLGSDSGKTFLEDHEDLKSQFLGFCLKKHHRKKQQEKERQEMLQKMNTTPARLEGHGVNYPAHRTPRYPSPSQQGIRPVTLMRAGGLKSGPVRHEPYPVRPRMPNMNAKNININPPVSKMPVTNQVIKIEVEDPDLAQSEKNQSATGTETSVTSQSLSPSHTAADTSSSLKDADHNSESSSSTIVNETPDLKLSDSSHLEGLTLESDYSSFLPQQQEESEGGPNTPQTPTSAPQTPGSTSALDQTVNVKVEALTESEMELEITGVELGPSQSAVDQVGAQDSWTPDMANLGYGGGAMGSQAEFQSSQSPYTKTSYFATKEDDIQKIDVTAKNKWRWDWISDPEFEKCFQKTLCDGTAWCKICQRLLKYGSSGKKALSSHMDTVHSPSGSKSSRKSNIGTQGSRRKKEHMCDVCGTGFNSARGFEEHAKTHTWVKPYRCSMCDKKFVLLSDSVKHMAKIHKNHGVVYPNSE